MVALGSIGIARVRQYASSAEREMRTFRPIRTAFSWPVEIARLMLEKEVDTITAASSGPKSIRSSAASGSVKQEVMPACHCETQ